MKKKTIGTIIVLFYFIIGIIARSFDEVSTTYLIIFILITIPIWLYIISKGREKISKKQKESDKPISSGEAMVEAYAEHGVILGFFYIGILLAILSFGFSIYIIVTNNPHTPASAGFILGGIALASAIGAYFLDKKYRNFT